MHAPAVMIGNSPPEPWGVSFYVFLFAVWHDFVTMASIPCDLSILHRAQQHQDRLRCASKADKEAGILKRAREKETSQAQLETEQMADEDEARGTAST